MSMVNNQTEDRYLDLRGLSNYSSLSIPCLRDYIRSGLMPAYKLKGKLIVRRSEYDAWIQKFRLKNINSVIDEVMESLR